MVSRMFSTLALLGLLVLTACGSYQPPAEQSPLAARQTAVALEQRPTLAPVAANGTPRPSPTALPELATLFDLRPDDPRALGDPAAPVTIVELTDFECPFCRQFARETRPQIVTEFVERGVVRLVVRDLPLTTIHPSAEAGAMAARCAAEQRQFWPMYERLFASHGAEWGGGGEGDRAAFVRFAAAIGLDNARFERCLDDPAIARAVAAERDAIAALGINATPAFFVNDTRILGGQSFQVFARLIAQARGSR